MYHPSPFGQIDHERGDCETRYQAIKKDYESKFGSFEGKTMIDVCCANGYFPFKFLLDGGKEARGVEIETAVVKFNNVVAKDKGLNFYTSDKLPDQQRYDIGLYLDTHYHGDTIKAGYLPWLRDNVDVLYTSSCRKTDVYYAELQAMFNVVDFVCDSKAKRKIYRCER